MKIEVGMYVRTKYGEIAKINECLGKDSGYKNMEHYETDRMVAKFNNFILYKEHILKASHNIIDLIEHKDIILGKNGKLYQCWKVYKDYVFTYSKKKQGQTITLVDYQIDKVMCYEQFESISYKVGE